MMFVHQHDKFNQLYDGLQHIKPLRLLA